MKKSEHPDEIIDRVYERFIEADQNQTKWTDLDTSMSDLEWIDDGQLMREAEMQYAQLYRKGTPRCRYDHKDGECFVPTILLAVLYIMDSFDKVAELDTKRQYILRYFLSLSSMGEIYSSK